MYTKLEEPGILFLTPTSPCEMFGISYFLCSNDCWWMAVVLILLKSIHTSKPCRFAPLHMPNCINLTQYVTIPAHKLGYTLYLVIAHSSSTLNSSIISSCIDTSDNRTVFKVNILLNPASTPKTFTYRRTKSIDYSKFISDDLNAFPLIKTPLNALTNLFDFYCSILRSLLDCRAPLLTKTKRSSCSAPSLWITSDILNLNYSPQSWAHIH